jgi:hypothetical protein
VKPFFVSDQPAVVSGLMTAQAAAGFGFRNPAYRGALAGDYRLIELQPGTRTPAPWLWRDAPNTLVIVGDDGGRSCGPQDFPQARRLMALAERIMLHAAGGEEAHYRLLAEAARLNHRVLLIETNTLAEAAWTALLQDEIARRVRGGLPQLAVLAITVPPNMPPHPTAPYRAEAPQ